MVGHFGSVLPMQVGADKLGSAVPGDFVLRIDLPGQQALLLDAFACKKL